MKKNRAAGIALAAIIGIITSGCATLDSGYVIDLESLSAGGDPKAYTYQIVSAGSVPPDVCNGELFYSQIDPAAKALPDDDLLFVKLKDTLADSLKKNGFKVADSPSKATARILFSPAIGTPVTRAAGSSYSRTTSSSASSYAYYGSAHSYADTSESSQTSYYYSTSYQKTINLEAREYSSSSKNPGKVIWRMNVLSSGSSNDLQTLMKYFVKGMGLYYGKDSDGRKSLRIDVYREDEDDDDDDDDKNIYKNALFTEKNEETGEEIVVKELKR